jgi:short subunit dehydrogenase-like uncharacterized protein
MAARDLDLVVFGATGVTGRRVCAYLAERAAATGSSWAAAGRDRGRVESVLAEDGVTAPAVLVADVADRTALAAMAAQARVVLNLAGPYTSHGRPVIDACVAGGAHYADLSGEIPFVRSVTLEVDVPARRAGVKVVQVCGFEALPPDLLVLLAAETARERHGEPLVSADVRVSIDALPGLPRPSDGISGGTFQSLAEAAGADDAAVLTDPAALLADGTAAQAVRRTSPIPVRPRRAPDGAVIAPMAPAAFINPAVIHRTGLLTATARGELHAPLRYREGLAIEGPPATLLLRLGAAGLLSGTQGLIAAMARAPASVRKPVANGLARVLPSSGFGPAADRLEAWRWSMRVDAATAQGHEVRAEVRAEGHPGYLATARMLGEAGLLMARPGDGPDAAGCLTPAAALGTASADRMAAARLFFTVA